MSGRMVWLCRSLGLASLAILAMPYLAFGDGVPEQRRRVETKGANIRAVAERGDGAVLQAAGALDPPTTSCTGDATQVTLDIQVCAGATGAPAGFSTHWMSCDDFDNWGGSYGGDGFPTGDGAPVGGALSASGNPACSAYDLVAPFQCSSAVQIGNLNDDECGVSFTNDVELACGTCYIFRSFAHNVPQGLRKSDWGNFARCNTADCPPQGETCNRTQGYWDTHDGNGPQANAWPNLSCTCGSGYMCMGGVCYTAAELDANLGLSGQGNGVVILSHQLIAAELNIQGGRGADCYTAAVAAARAAGHALLVGRNINTSSCLGGPQGGNCGGTIRAQMIAAGATLEAFNSGACHCTD